MVATIVSSSARSQSYPTTSALEAGLASQFLDGATDTLYLGGRDFDLVCAMLPSLKYQHAL